MTAQATVATGIWADRRARTAQLCGRYEFAREVLDFYGALLGAQELAYEEAISAQPRHAELAAYTAERVVPAVVEVSIAAGPDKLREAVARHIEGVDPRDMVAAWMNGDEQPLVDRYVARASLSPVLEALGPDAASSCGGVRDERHCPSCGGPPQLSYFAVASEDLAAGGRFLVCARCHAGWGFARMTCPGCGQNSSSRLPIFSEEGTASGERGSVVRGLQGKLGDTAKPEHEPVFRHVRIEACDTCRTYLLSIDLAADPAAVPLVDEMAALPLDIYAKERGLSKITPNLMGF